MHTTKRSQWRRLVVPIQITVTKTHKDSEAAFFSQWSHWQEYFRGYEVTTAFVWIVENYQEPFKADFPRA